MPNQQPVLKNISEIVPVKTSHGIGEKRVLLSQKEYPSPVTQIAQTGLKAGEVVESHSHPTMDEHFVFLEGKCEVTMDGKTMVCEGGQYLLMPAGTQHRIKVITNTVMLTVGIALD